MNRLFLAAASLAFIVGLVHSILGEALIFRRMRERSLIPTNGGRVLGEGHVRILWASWHILTVFGWCLAAILLWLSQAQPAGSRLLSQAIVIAMLAASLLVLVGTKGRHPGWVGLLGVAVLAWLASP
jgi:hypothetical protein